MYRIQYKFITGRLIGLTFFGNSNFEPVIGEITKTKQGNYQVVSYLKIK